MELAIRNKWFSFKGSSVVKDLNEQDVCKVDGKFLTFTSKKFVKSLDGDLKYIVRNKFWRLFTYRAFILDPEGNEVAMIRRKIFSLHDKYRIYSKLGEFEIVGNIFQFNYRILFNGNEVGHIARKVSLRDSFVLTISDDLDYYFYVALVIAIDNITDRKDNRISVGDGD